MSTGAGSGTNFSTMRGRDYPSLRQFTVFLENRVGQLLEIVRRFEGSNVRIVALSINDATECCFVRFLLSDPEGGREILERAGLALIESDLIGVELPAEKQPLLRVCTALLQSEVNIVQAYPLLYTPNNRAAVALMVDNTDIAMDTLLSRNFKVLTEDDLKFDDQFFRRATSTKKPLKSRHQVRELGFSRTNRLPGCQRWVFVRQNSLQDLSDIIRTPYSPSDTGSRMIHVRDLVKSYDDLQLGKFTAVDHISFFAMPGEIFGLLGPNGAGKTTALRILSTVLEPTSGTVQIAGYDVTTEPAMVRHKIGFMSANTAVYDRMTAWEMVEYFGKLYGLPDHELHDRMEELFHRLGMREIRDVLGAKMSTGMKQKVSIARALVHDPPVLIFDEPTLGLDVFVARALVQLISELRDQGKCIIFSSHIMREVEKLCDKVAIMNRGKILAEGTIDQLRTQYNQPDLEELFFHLIGEPDGIAN